MFRGESTLGWCCPGHSLYQQIPLPKQKSRLSTICWKLCMCVCPSLYLPVFPLLSQHTPHDYSGPQQHCLDSDQTTQQGLWGFNKSPNSPDINEISSDDGIYRKAAQSTETPLHRPQGLTDLLLTDWYRSQMFSVHVLKWVPLVSWGGTTHY